MSKKPAEQVALEVLTYGIPTADEIKSIELEFEGDSLNMAYEIWLLRTKLEVARNG